MAAWEDMRFVKKKNTTRPGNEAWKNSLWSGDVDRWISAETADARAAVVAPQVAVGSCRVCPPSACRTADTRRSGDT